MDDRSPQDSVDLQEFLSRLVDAANPAQIGLYPFHTGQVEFVVHSSKNEEVKQIESEIDVIDVAGNLYNYGINVDPYSPQSLGRVSLYVAESVVNMESVDVSKGTEIGEEKIPEVVEQDPVFLID